MNVKSIHFYLYLVIIIIFLFFYKITCIDTFSLKMILILSHVGQSSILRIPLFRPLQCPQRILFYIHEAVLVFKCAVIFLRFKYPLGLNVMFLLFFINKLY